MPVESEIIRWRENPPAMNDRLKELSRMQDMVRGPEAKRVQDWINYLLGVCDLQEKRMDRMWDRIDDLSVRLIAAENDDGHLTRIATLERHDAANNARLSSVETWRTLHLRMHEHEFTPGQTDQKEGETGADTRQEDQEVHGAGRPDAQVESDAAIVDGIKNLEAAVIQIAHALARAKHVYPA